MVRLHSHRPRVGGGQGAHTVEVVETLLEAWAPDARPGGAVPVQEQGASVLVVGDDGIFPAHRPRVERRQGAHGVEVVGD